MSDVKMKIYNASPIWAQNLLTSMQGYQYKRRRYGKHYKAYLEELSKRDYSDKEAQREYQDQRFLSLVRHAMTNSPFYREFYSDVDISVIRGVQDIGLLPILEKEMVRRNLEAMYTIPASTGVVINPSGSTGTPRRVLYTHEDLQRRMAYLDHFKAQHGFVSGKMRRASFTTAKIVPAGQTKKVFWRDNISIKQRLYSGYHCKGDNIPFYVDSLNKFKPLALDGLPSSIYEIARYVNENNITLKFTPIAIFPTAETLLPHYRSAIEKAFNCPVRDQYASSEGAPFITECPFGNLHYNMDTGVIEVDQNGEMIVTCFETYGTPLIRYMIGDRLVMGDPNDRCECGSSHPIVDRIEGRGVEFLESLSNGRFSAIYLSLVSEEFLNSVKRMQFVQETLSEITILLEVDDRYSPNMDRIIIDKLKYSFGDDMTFSVKVVEEIPKDASGKYRLIRSNIPV